MNSSASSSSSSSSAFEQIAKAYGLLVNEGARWEREHDFLTHWIDVADENRSPSGPGLPRILDLGCGTGFHARHLALKLGVESIVGADPAEAMLAVARQKEGGELVEWVGASVEEPPTGVFDLVLLLGNTMSLIREIQPIWPALQAVTQAGSIFIFQMLDYESLRNESMAPRVTERSGGGVSICKILTVRARGGELLDDNVAADLSLVIRDDGGQELAAEEHLLYEHPESSWLADAEAAGWEVVGRQSSFDAGIGEEEGGTPAKRGSDRVYILKRR